MTCQSQTFTNDLGRYYLRTLITY